MQRDLKMSQTWIKDPPSFVISTNCLQAEIELIYFFDWEVRLKFFYKLRQVVIHWLAEWMFNLSLFYNSCCCVKMSKVPAFTLHFHNSSLALNAATLSENLKTVVIFPWNEKLSSLSKLKMSHRWASFETQSVLLKYSASGDSFSWRNLCKDSSNSKTLDSNLCLESHLTFVYKRRPLCYSSISSELIKQMRIKGMYFDVVNNFNHILQNTVNLRW